MNVSLKMVQTAYTNAVKRLDAEYKEKRRELDNHFDEQRTILNKTILEMTTEEFEKAKAWIAEIENKNSASLRQEVPTKTTLQRRKDARDARREQVKPAETNPKRGDLSNRIRNAITAYKVGEKFTVFDIAELMDEKPERLSGNLQRIADQKNPILQACGVVASPVPKGGKRKLYQRIA